MLLTVACARPKFLVRATAPRRRIKQKDIENAINHARHYEETTEVKEAWEVVEILTTEFSSQNKKKLFFRANEYRDHQEERLEHSNPE